MSEAWGTERLLSDELVARVDERTLRILDRRSTAPGHRRGRLVRRALLGADVLALLLAFSLATTFLAGPGSPSNRLSANQEYLLLVLLVPIWIALARLYGLYSNDEDRTDHATADDLVGVFHLATMGTWLVFAIAWLTHVADPYIPKVVAFWALAIGLVTLFRALARAWCRRHLDYLQNTVIVGAGEIGQIVARTFLRSSSAGVNLVGFVDSEPRESHHDVCHIPLLGPPGSLPELVRALDIERVVVAFSNERDEEILDIVRSLEPAAVHIDVVPRLFELLGPSARLFDVQGFPFLSVSPPQLSAASVALKRAFDIVGAGLLLLLLAPVLAYMALRVKLDSPGPAFYRSERVGTGGRHFRLLKLRTMRLDACRGPGYGGLAADAEFWRLLASPDRYKEFEETHKLEDDPRVTAFGRRLRSASLDELPQLVNVLSGDLSLVGPRAITVDELEAFGLEAQRPGLHPYWEIRGLKPGVTGLWQISGRSVLSYSDRIRLDLLYAGSQSLRLDLLLLAKTVRVLLTRQGAA